MSKSIQEDTVWMFWELEEEQNLEAGDFENASASGIIELYEFEYFDEDFGIPFVIDSLRMELAPNEFEMPVWVQASATVRDGGGAAERASRRHRRRCRLVDEESYCGRRN